MFSPNSFIKKGISAVTKTNRLIVIGGVASITCGAVCANYVSVKWGMGMLMLMVNISAILFGVFGIWLGMFYHPEVIHEMNGKQGDELKDIAQCIIENARRFEIVFRGMKISACIIIFSMIVHLLVPFQCLFEVFSNGIKLFAKILFFSGVVLSVLAQCYSVLTAVAPMLDAKKRMDKARDDAEQTLSL